MRRIVETARQATEIQSAGMRLTLLCGSCRHFLVDSSAKAVDPLRVLSSIEHASAFEHLAANSSRATSVMEEELKNMRVQPTSAAESRAGGPRIEKRLPVDQCFRYRGDDTDGPREFSLSRTCRVRLPPT